MCSRIAVLAAMLAVAPLGAKAADLVVWWERGSNPEDDAAVREIIAAFEQETGKQVDLEQRRRATLRPRPLPPSPTGKTPDFLFGTNGQWAGAGRLIEHSDVVGPFASSVRPGRPPLLADVV
jgi:multiple sugar transport system substrate-binding protein